MKKYETLNFFEENNNRSIYISRLLMLCIIIFTFLNLSVNTIKLRRLESNINHHEIENACNDEVEYVQEKNIDLNQVKFMYSLFGVSNINEMTILKDNVQVQGKCTDLNILEEIKNNDNIKKSSLDSITKEDDSYIFKLKYQTGSSI
jgi:type IV pilus assembly protein PilN